MKKVFKIILICFVILIAIAAAATFYISRGLSEGMTVELQGVSPYLLEDGSYAGSYKNGRFSNEVSVSVKEGLISEIIVVNDMKIKQDELTNQLFEQVIEEQNTNIDAITGATVSCNAYLKAIENALNQ